MLTIILMILGYIVIGGITAGVLGAITDDAELVLASGLIWPLAIPLLIVTAITIFISALVLAIIDIIIPR